MSSSPQFVLGYDRDWNLCFEDKGAAIQLVKALKESSAYCGRCYVPFRGEAKLGGLPLDTFRTFESRTELTKDVPPDEVDESGGVVDVSRDSLDICGCGWIDIPPGQNRSREATLAHLENILALLAENGADVNARAARAAVNQAFDDRRGEQFTEVVGEAVYYALEDS